MPEMSGILLFSMEPSGFFKGFRKRCFISQTQASSEIYAHLADWMILKVDSVTDIYCEVKYSTNFHRKESTGDIVINLRSRIKSSQLSRNVRFGRYNRVQKPIFPHRDRNFKTLTPVLFPNFLDSTVFCNIYGIILICS